MKLSSAAAIRNREVIADRLAEWLPTEGRVLEIASGTGEHVIHFAERLPRLVWQPSDPDPDALASIADWRAEASPANLLPPIRLDASAANWLVERMDAVVCINMVHISPWAATLGLIDGAARLLVEGAPLILYGPFRQHGVPIAPSNEAFDASLKDRDPAWGLRHVEDVRDVAAPFFSLDEVAQMPANNLMLLFRRTGATRT